jgi:hypothetical protein
MQWWYVKDGERHGPIEDPEFKAMAADGRLGRGDLVWNSAMGQDWKKAGDVAGVFPEQQPAADAAAVQAAAAPSEQPRSQLTMPSQKAVSVTAPVDAAWEGMKKILFKPFDMGKWFALGFSAWLAALMEGGSGGNFSNFNSGGGGNGGGFGEMASGARDAWTSMHSIIVVAIVALIIVGFAVGIVATWVRCRGKFMFLDNVIHNTDRVKAPWREFSQHGNSLFKWTLVYSIIMLLVVLVLLGAAFVGVILPCIKAETFVTSTIPVIVIVGLLFMAVAIVGAYIMRFLEDFIVPIMYRKDMTATEAWSYFGNIYRANTGKLILYGLFYFLLTLGAGMVVGLATIATCCILGCIAAIPYVGTVVLLPVPVFFRLYGIHYIAQFGPDLDLVTGGSECNTAA